MRCSNCGTDNPENAKFCIECAAVVNFPEAKPSDVPEESPVPTSQQQPSVERPRRGGMILKLAAIIVIAFIAVLIAMLVVGGLTESDGGWNAPWEPTYYGTIRVDVENDDWFSGYDYRIYIDGDLVDSDHIGTLTSESSTCSVSWKGESIHQFTVVLTTDGDSTSRSVFVEDGGTATVSFTI